MKEYRIEPVFSTTNNVVELTYEILDKTGISHITGTFKECQKWISDNTFKN